MTSPPAAAPREAPAELRAVAPEVAVDPRLVWAAERTLLAWIRTSIALMALGFVIARFGTYATLGLDHVSPVSAGLATALGVALVAGGTGILVAAALRHRAAIAALERGRRAYGSAVGPLAAAAAVAALGVALAVALVVASG